ncbi:MAG TPA: hypothetical protein VFI70_09735 [Nitrososphaeraceae archaeon]|nr:hypothetical protein [Nitrososphaeraceae archaeon]
MISDKALLDIPIKDAAAHIFRRPFLFVNPTAHMLQIATFLAIGPQIYADGLIVINESNNKPIGRISSKHAIAITSDSLGHSYENNEIGITYCLEFQ